MRVEQWRDLLAGRAIVAIAALLVLIVIGTCSRLSLGCCARASTRSGRAELSRPRPAAADRAQRIEQQSFRHESDLQAPAPRPARGNPGLVRLGRPRARASCTSRSRARSSCTWRRRAGNERADAQAAVLAAAALDLRRRHRSPALLRHQRDHARRGRGHAGRRLLPAELPRARRAKAGLPRRRAGGPWVGIPLGSSSERSRAARAVRVVVVARLPPVRSVARPARAARSTCT